MTYDNKNNPLCLNSIEMLFKYSLEQPFQKEVFLGYLFIPLTRYHIMY